MARRDLEMTEALVHSWWAAEENGDVLVCGVYPGESGFAQFHQEAWDTGLGLQVLVVAQGKG